MVRDSKCVIVKTIERDAQPQGTSNRDDVRPQSLTCPTRRSAVGRPGIGAGRSFHEEMARAARGKIAR